MTTIIRKIKAHHGDSKDNKESEAWLFFSYVNKLFKKPSNAYKLHLSLDLKHFDRTQEDITDTLIFAMQRGVIAGFKVINMHQILQSNIIAREKIKLLEAALKNKKNASYMEALDKWKEIYIANLRYMQMPYVIYLYDDITLNNFENIGKLCTKIQEILKDVAPGNARFYCPGDLVFPQGVSHRNIVFRQAKLDGRYIAAFDKDAIRLKAGALTSKHYQKLKDALLVESQKISANDAKTIVAAPMRIFGAAQAAVIVPSSVDSKTNAVIKIGP